MSERMNIKTVFVGGPIQHAFSDKIFNNSLHNLIETVLSKLENEGFNVLSAHRFESYGQMDVEELKKEVCARDFNWMKSCDAFVAVLPAEKNMLPVRTDGTCVELGWASALGKKIVIIGTPEGKYSHLVAGLSATARTSYVECEEVYSLDFKFGPILRDEPEACTRHDFFKEKSNVAPLITECL